MIPIQRPWCAICDRPVETAAILNLSNGDAEVTVVCHGHVDVFLIERALRVAISTSDSGSDLMRVFTGGPGKPIDGAAPVAVSRTT